MRNEVRGIGTLMNAAIAANATKEEFDISKAAGCSARLGYNCMEFVRSVKDTVEAIAEYCFVHKDESFIKESYSGLMWSAMHTTGLKDVDSVIGYTSLGQQDWVAFADDEVTSLVQTLKQIVGGLNVSVHQLISYIPTA